MKKLFLSFLMMLTLLPLAAANKYDNPDTIVVSRDGTGEFRTIASAIATFLLAFMAKLPFAQAPSMGLNAFFAFTLCQAMGLTWQQALADVVISQSCGVLPRRLSRTHPPTAYASKPCS